MGFQKLKPQVITYRNYKIFDNNRFQAGIKTCGFDTKNINSFKETILSVFSMLLLKRNIFEQMRHFYDKKLA